jgi:ferredoxin
MNALPQAIQTTIADWLQKGEIEVFIGYEAGTVPLRATPFFLRRAEEVTRLIWDATCENNLTAFLPKFRGKKVGILVKGCDSRALVGLMQEGQLVRENLRIVGVNCPGVLDPRRVASALSLPLDDLDEAALEGDTIRVGNACGVPVGDACGVPVEEARVPLAEAIHAVCRTCTAHNPALYDVVFGAPQEDASGDPFAEVRAIAALSDDERWARFIAELQRCNLCYACRQACPLCYCNTCFADRTLPRWVNQTSAAQDIQFFQIMRTFHLAGRCVGCGACTRACPQGINLRLLLDKLRLDAQELYGYEAGVDPTARPPLTTYREDDYNGFVM